jgi:serine-threonine kinase receptor-associated protein
MLTHVSNSKIWNTRTGVNIYTLPHNHIVRSVAFQPITKPFMVATGGAEKKLRIWDIGRDLPTSSPVSEKGFETAHNGTNGTEQTETPNHEEIGAGIFEGTIKSIIWGPDENTLITASDDKKIRWWDVRNKTCVGSFEVEGLIGSCELGFTNGDQGNADANALGPVAQGQVLSVAAGKSVYFFEAATRRLLKAVKLPYEVYSVALHATARKFVTGGAGDTWVRVYDFDSEEELGESPSNCLC